MNIALAVIALFFFIALAAGVLARRGVQMSLDQWAVAGRGFGTIVSFILLAGEVFSTYSFLGATGWAYSKGAPTFYYMACAALACIVGYWMLPRLRRYAQEHRLISFSDFFQTRFNSPLLGLVVSAIALLAMIPLLVIQLKGLGIIVSESSYGSLSENTAIWIGVVMMAVYITISGIRGAATVAVIKDIGIFVLAIFLAVYLPLHYFGSFSGMFETILKTKPQHFDLPKTGLNVTWYNSTVLLVALGYYLYPYSFTSIYAAKSENTVRKNLILMPMYQTLITCMYMVGFAAIAVVPGLRGADADLALFRISKATFAPWLVGVIGGIGLLTAVVPGAMILLNSSTMFAKNIFKLHLAPNADEARVTRVARMCVPVYALVAVLVLFYSGLQMVPLALFASNLLCQLFPAFAVGIFRKRPLRAASGLSGIGVSILVVATVTFGFNGSLRVAAPWLPETILSSNLGLVALGLNAIIFFFVDRLLSSTMRKHAQAIPLTIDDR